MKLRQYFSRPVFWITGLSLLWAVFMALNLEPDLRGSFGWQWPYDPVLNLRRLLPITLGVVAYTGVAIRLLRNRSSAGLLLWAMVGSIGLPLAAAYVREDVLFRFYAVTVSGATRAQGGLGGRTSDGRGGSFAALGSRKGSQSGGGELVSGAIGAP